MRQLYSLLFYLALPFILCRLLWRSLKAPPYRQRWLERFGFYNSPIIPNGIWFHAVSVGEAEAVFPLIKSLKAKLMGTPILVTTTTPTGSARVKAVLGESVQHVYLPYDTPGSVSRFMAAFNPTLAVIVETELWPNLFNYCGRRNIPLYVVNARISERSVRGYGKLPSLIQPLLNNIKLIAAQTSADAQRFAAIGAKPEQLEVAGNIKFDLDIPEPVFVQGRQLKKSAFHDRYVWIAASTHKGEEQIILDAYKALKSKLPQLLLVIVPRHPERFAEVNTLCADNGLQIVTRTSNLPCHSKTDVYLGDTMGELKMLYAASDAAFVGGSLVPVGGHNILEASAVGLPVLFGPYMANFKEIAEKVLAQQAAVQCLNQYELITTLQKIHSDKDYRNSLIQKGKLFIQTNRGAVDRLSEILIAEIRQGRKG